MAGARASTASWVAMRPHTWKTWPDYNTPCDDARNRPPDDIATLATFDDYRWLTSAAAAPWLERPRQAAPQSTVQLDGRVAPRPFAGAGASGPRASRAAPPRAAEIRRRGADVLHAARPGAGDRRVRGRLQGRRAFRPARRWPICAVASAAICWRWPRVGRRPASIAIRSWRCWPRRIARFSRQRRTADPAPSAVTGCRRRRRR